MSGWAAYGGQSGVISTDRDGRDVRLLQQEGQVEALSWGSALPGGDQVLNMTLAMDRRYRTQAMRVGRFVKVFRGDTVWRGTMAEPQADEMSGGWAVSCQGEGTYGNNFRAVSGGGAAGSNGGGTPASANTMVSDAIGRGLPWTLVQNLDAVAGMDLTQLFERGSRSVTEALNSFTSGSSDGAVPVALTWAVRGYRSELRVFPLPPISKPTRLLISADAVGRSITGYYDTMYLRYQSSQDGDGGAAATYDLASAQLEDPVIRRHGRLEGYGDYSNAGYMTGGNAGSRARGVLSAYQAVSYTQEWTATPGQVLTLGGSPVDLGTEKAGEVYQVLGADLGAGAEVSAADQVVFLCGAYVWDDVAQAARLTPYNFVAQDFGSLVSAMAPPPVMPTNLG
jgi:hypothetical protein